MFTISEDGDDGSMIGDAMIDTSLIHIRANAALVGFGTYSDSPSLPFFAIEIENVCGYAIFISQCNYTVSTPGITNFPQNTPFGVATLTAALAGSQHIAILNGAPWTDTVSLFGADNGVYNSSLTLDTIAGFAFTWPANGVSSNVNYATFTPGITVLSWKKAVGLTIPFSGTIDYVP